MKRLNSKRRRGIELSSSRKKRKFPFKKSDFTVTALHAAFREMKKRKIKIKGNVVSSDNNPYGIIFRDNHQRARYETLVQRKIVRTRYMDRDTLDTLGIYNDVGYLIENVAWLHFVNMKLHTYEKITIEFLSSVKAQIVQGPESDHGLITFRLFNQEYRLSLAQFNAIYKFPCGGDRATPREYREQEFWAKLAPGSSFVHGKTESSSLRNPCFRYVHMFLSTIFGRGVSEGTISSTELMFLWAMVTSDVALDTGSRLIRHLVTVGSSPTGDIEIGGLVTPIATSLGHDLSSLKPVCGSYKFDIEACIDMKMIMKTGDTYSLLFPNSDVTHPLPDPARTYVYDDESYWCCPVGPRPEDIAAVRALRERVEEEWVHMEGNVDDIYNWCLDMYPGQLPPPPRPLAYDNVAAVADEFENQCVWLQRINERRVRLKGMIQTISNWFDEHRPGKLQPIPQTKCVRKEEICMEKGPKKDPRTRKYAKARRNWSQG